MLYNLDSKPRGLFSKRESRQHTCTLEIHCKGGLTFEGGGLSIGRGLTLEIYTVLLSSILGGSRTHLLCYFIKRLRMNRKNINSGFFFQSYLGYL